MSARTNAIARIVRHRRERVEIARIGELVDDQHVMRRLADEVAHDRRADEAGAAGDEKALSHHAPSYLKGDLKSAKRPSVLSLSDSTASPGRDRPVDRQRRIVPDEAAVARRRIEFVDLVGDHGVGLERAERRGRSRAARKSARRPRPSESRRPTARRWASPPANRPRRRIRCPARRGQAWPARRAEAGNAGRARCPWRPTATGCPARISP